MILLTGATGYLGGEVAAQLLEADAPVMFLARGDDPVQRPQHNISRYRPHALPVRRDRARLASSVHQPAPGQQRPDAGDSHICSLIRCGGASRFHITNSRDME